MRTTSRFIGRGKGLVRGHQRNVTCNDFPPMESQYISMYFVLVSLLLLRSSVFVAYYFPSLSSFSELVTVWKRNTFSCCFLLYPIGSRKSLCSHTVGTKRDVSLVFHSQRSEQETHTDFLLQSVGQSRLFGRPILGLVFGRTTRRRKEEKSFFVINSACPSLHYNKIHSKRFN